jgi:excisionase family DNA binding protein
MASGRSTLAPSPTGITRATPVDALPELLTAQEAADWLGISVWSAYDLCRRDVLPHRRLGKHVRIQRAGLEQLAGRRVIETE